MELGTLQIRIQRSENLPVMSQVVSKVLKLVESPNASPREMEKVVESDAAITAKILKVANSPFYGGASVPTVGRAISVLGMNAIKSLVVGIAYQQMISGGQQQSAQLFNKFEFWQHSLAVATGARLIGKIKVPMKAEELYVAGMMHDVGMLIMDRFMPVEFDNAIRRAQDTGEPIYLAEEEVYGFDHATVGALLGDKWNLSPLIRRAIEFHHQPDNDGDYFDTTSIVTCCNVLAHQAGFTNSSTESNMEMGLSVAQAIDMDDEQLQSIRDVMIKEVTLAQQLFCM
ncbi:MAG: HDOD domain-containing protein [Fimbriimonadaceae bacterium]|nr:HDOD domain-containing protein [Fimbriimonadaceae bacterium]